MSAQATVNTILSRKGVQVWSVTPDTLVSDAILLMAEKNIGALLVMSGDQLEGVISERDYTRKVFLKGKSSRETPVREIMFSPVISVSTDHTVEECMRIMTDKRIRHLPVLSAGKVAGLISIGDLVNWIISSQQATINHLENYISGKYPA
jgi:CBS domain-containing protein